MEVITPRFRLHVPGHTVVFELKGLLSGSFNPIHDGHRNLRRVARQFLGGEVAYEISSLHPDKGDIPDEEMGKRLRQFSVYDPFVVSRAPLFLDKARLFPGVAFIVGLDTAERLINRKYYKNQSEGAMYMAMDEFVSLGTRFIVAPRDEDSFEVFHEKVVFPYGPLFVELEGWEEHPISSTQLREAGQGL